MPCRPGGRSWRRSGSARRRRCGRSAAPRSARRSRSPEAAAGGAPRSAPSRSRLSAPAWRVSARICLTCSRDPHPRAALQPTQASLDPIELSRLLERAAPKRALELGAKLKQLPAQPVLGARALGDEIFAMVGEQPDLHRPPVEVGAGEALNSILDHRPGDRERVDLVRLARLSLAAPRGAHPLRRNPDDALASGDQRLLEPARDVPAVLDRPHPLPRPARAPSAARPDAPAPRP